MNWRHNPAVDHGSRSGHNVVMTGSTTDADARTPTGY